MLKRLQQPLGVTNIYNIALELNSLQGYKDPYQQYSGRNKEIFRDHSIPPPLLNVKKYKMNREAHV